MATYRSTKIIEAIEWDGKPNTYKEVKKRVSRPAEHIELLDDHDLKITIMDGIYQTAIPGDYLIFDKDPLGNTRILHMKKERFLRTFERFTESDRVV